MTDNKDSLFPSVFFGELHRPPVSQPTNGGALTRRQWSSRELSAASPAACRVADSCRLGKRPPVGKNPIVGWLAGSILQESMLNGCILRVSMLCRIKEIVGNDNQNCHLLCPHSNKKAPENQRLW